ncbi:hypothetical protein ElyMa_001171400 [Elysia marginata]|uniref:Uncharacterized protein n=1 Tax=Elysia marginata TaxID=1093978 RepID=A0AAV4I414_9GAST|nr:hypothetical protein ElyMa_001171400 [Elysia marginata]
MKIIIKINIDDNDFSDNYNDASAAAAADDDDDDDDGGDGDDDDYDDDNDDENNNDINYPDGTNERQQRKDTHSKEIKVKMCKPFLQFTEEVFFCLESHAS